MKKVYLFTHFCHYLALITGIGYFLILHYFKIVTQYGVRPNPWQGYWQGAHILVVPALVFAIGMLWKDHIYPKYQKREQRKRKSGLILIISFFLMGITGYLIQVMGGVETIIFIKNFHFYSSLIWSLAYGVHQFS